MAIVTGTVTINAAFLQEIKTDHLLLRELFTEAREQLSIPERMPLHTRALAELLQQLLDQLALHFALEEAIGYFEDAMQAAPRLSVEAEALRNEHGALFEELRAIVERAQRCASAGGMSLRQARALSRSFGKFDSHYQSHEARENELIMIAFEQDIGVGD